MTKGVQDRMIAVEKVRDAFHSAVFQRRDVDAAAALLTGDCSVENRPGGTTVGADRVRTFLAEDLMAHLPADLAFRRVSRTGDRWRVAQEDIVRFTHDRELPWLLPGVAATGRTVEVLAISVAEIDGSSIKAYRTLWDHAALLEQLGLDQPARLGSTPVNRPAAASRSAGTGP